MTPVVRILLFANIGAYFLQMTQPALANGFVFYPDLVLRRPWTAITYMFLHGSLMHIGFNTVPFIELFTTPPPTPGVESGDEHIALPLLLAGTALCARRHPTLCRPARRAATGSLGAVVVPFPSR